MTPETVWQTIELMQRAEQMSQQLDAQLDHVRTAIEKQLSQGLDVEDVPSPGNAPEISASVSSDAVRGRRVNSSEKSDAVVPSQPLRLGAPIAERIRDSVRAQVDEAVLDFIRGPARVFMDKFNWFPDPEMSLTRFRELAKHQDASRAEAELAGHARSRITRYRDGLCEWFPSRDGIIRSAFAAHERGDYTLSVPVLLMQADGICFDLTERNLFVGRDRPELEKKFETAARFRRILLQPLAGELPLTASATRRDSSFNTLNRHQVIHGEVTNYGTEANSLRAVAFLFYVGYVLKNANGASEV